MTSQGGAAGEIALRLAEIATSTGGVGERDIAILRLLRAQLKTTFIAVYKAKTRAGKALTLRTRASDEGVINTHPYLVKVARDAARVWLAAGVATPCVLEDTRFGGWQVAGCLPGGAHASLAVVSVWPPDGDAGTGAEILAALEAMLSLALGRGTRRTHAPGASDETPKYAARAGFVSLVSHAMRTPLNTLTGFVEIVLDQPVGPLNERQREFLEYARTSGHALTQVVEDVTLLSHADEGTLTLRYQWADAAEIAQGALRTLETVAQAKSVLLNLRVDGEALSLEGDGERLAHALTKVLENAVKFSPEGSEVTLTVTASNGLANFAVRDEGPGIAPEDTQRIFTRFYQAEGTAKSHPGGYGLGLAVAKVIALAHGGDIRVESAPGQGATFTLSIPISSTSANHRAATKSKRGASGAVSKPS
jgi:signal transduction histidine kinase